MLRRRCGLTQAMPISNRYLGMKTVSVVFKVHVLIYTLKHVFRKVLKDNRNCGKVC